jgi:glycosyltransferase involved in cell wall biosynthesis
VTIPTRGRAEHLRACAESILACPGPSLELIVVDQSDDRGSEEALRPLFGDDRLRYVRTETRGMCRARNVGIRQSRGDILVCTDDDCRATPEWLERIHARFARDPELSLLCGKVWVPRDLFPNVYRDGSFASAFDAPLPTTTLATLSPRVCGISSNMSFRRALYERIGGFDEALGVGGPLGSGSEPDFVFRALRAGLKVENDTEALILHLGVRAPAEVGPLWKRYYFGAGAAFGKHMRLGDLTALRVFLRYVSEFALPALKDLGHLRRPRGAGTILAMLRGVRGSFRFPVDRGQRLYVVRPS